MPFALSEIDQKPGQVILTLLVKTLQRGQPAGAGLFLETELFGAEIKYSNKNLRIKVRVLANKPVHSVQVVPGYLVSFITLRAKPLKPRS